MSTPALAVHRSTHIAVRSFEVTQALSRVGIRVEHTDDIDPDGLSELLPGLLRIRRDTTPTQKLWALDRAWIQTVIGPHADPCGTVHPLLQAVPDPRGTNR